jgi:hypothetical protein
LRLKIGGFFAILTHANTADRTYTLPDATTTLVGTDTTQTLTGKTLDGDDNTLQDVPLTAIKTVGANTKRFITRDASGVISDAASPAFDNANHTHQDAAGGGTLDTAAIGSGTLGVARGGTGAATHTAHNALIGNGTSAITSLAPGTNRNAMISDGTDWASRALVDADIPDALTVSGGSVENTPVGSATPALGYFSALRLKIAGFFAIFTHANSADRTYTFPDKDGTVAMISDIAASGAPADATYIVQTSNGTLTNEQAMSALATGLVKNTTTTGVQSIAAAGTDYTSPTGTENLSGKTITTSSLVATALSLLIGGFKAIFTHSNSADRTYTLPNYDGTLATLAGTETLAAKTLTTPTVSATGFANANHAHTGSTSGGTLDVAAIGSGVLSEARGGTARATGAATKALDNLASVALNTALLPASDNSLAFGSQPLRFTKLYGINPVMDAPAIAVLNSSGGSVAVNDVGYMDYSATNGYEFKSTTTANLNGVQWCVVTDIGASGNDATTIYVSTMGKVTVLLNANCSIGNFLTTSTTAKRAAVNTLMRPEVFAIALTANAGGAGGTCTAQLLTRTRQVLAKHTSDIYDAFAVSTSSFVSTISGAPSTTSVVYGAVSVGNENVIVPGVATLIARLRIWNTTRNTYRLVTAVNTATNTITTVASTDSWANGDTITFESQTTITGATNKYGEVDISQSTVIPTLARHALVTVYARDSGITGTPFAFLLPYEAYIANEGAPVNAANLTNNTIFPIKLISGVLCVSWNASGTGTQNPAYRFQGYDLAIP